jgi:Xaa-Pro aminopeptidase
MNTGLREKLAQVRALLKATKMEAVLVGKQPNFSWLACGGEAHITFISDRAFGNLLVTPKKFYVLANRIEMPRLQDEVLRGLGAEPLAYNWYDEREAARIVKEIADPRKIISDTGDYGTRLRPDLLAPLRYALQPVEVKRLRALARTAEAAMHEACHKLKPGQDEFTIAGQLALAAWQRKVTPVVLLVATDERIHKYRHPLPTKKKLKRYAMLVLCARENGLIVSLTRMVHFGKLSPDLRRRHDATCVVDVAFNSSTRVGTPIREIFRRGTAAYAEQGFPDEWQKHHQGGPCGYDGRDFLGTPNSPGVVLENQAYAWNPSITGTKSEDTILATARGPEILTQAKDWPMVRAEWRGAAMERADILVR